MGNVAPLFPLLLLLLLVLPPIPAELAQSSCNITVPSREALAEHTASLFTHAYTAYLKHAHPADELQPLTCTPIESFGGLSVTEIDALTTLIILDQPVPFRAALAHITSRHTFAISQTVSVFETTIRVLGALLSAHIFLLDLPLPTRSLWAPAYDGALLTLATDLADRLLPAFDTPTGIPYGSIHLISGVDPTETTIASTAAAGSLLLEFGTLTRLTRHPAYYRVAFRAAAALHALAAASTGLVGNHIDVATGRWVALEAGVGGGVDSFYEYLLKGYILFGDARLLAMHKASVAAISKYVHKAPWYLDVNMDSGKRVSQAQRSLAAFWPGLQVLDGAVGPAGVTARAVYGVWKKFGALPEGFDVVEGRVAGQERNSPLRPELAESVFYLHWATDDPAWVGAARGMLFGLEKIARVPCGFAAVKDVRSRVLEDLMPSFLLSETLKYLYLVFKEDHWIRNGRFVFTTEAHPLPVGDEEEMRGILGGDFDEGGFGKVGWQKCARGKKAERLLPCGFGMDGMDLPIIGKEEELGEVGEVSAEIAEKVMRMVRKRRNKNRVGDIIFGKKWACRIDKIVEKRVYYERLDGVEADLERELNE